MNHRVFKAVANSTFERECPYEGRQRFFVGVGGSGRRPFKCVFLFRAAFLGGARFAAYGLRFVHGVPWTSFSWQGDSAGCFQEVLEGSRWHFGSPEPIPNFQHFGYSFQHFWPTGWLPTTFDPCTGIGNQTLAVYQKPPRRGRIHIIRVSG